MDEDPQLSDLGKQLIIELKLMPIYVNFISEDVTRPILKWNRAMKQSYCWIFHQYLPSIGPMKRFKTKKQMCSSDCSYYFDGAVEITRNQIGGSVEQSVHKRKSVSGHHRVVSRT